MLNIFKNNVIKIITLAVFAIALVILVVSDNSNKAGNGNASLLQQFFIAGGWIVWFILLPMSLLTVYFAVEYAVTIRRKNLFPEGIGDEIIEKAERLSKEELAEELADKEDFVSGAVLKVLRAQTCEYEDVKNAAADALQENAMKLLRRIEWVNIIGNVSPMVGLFGTVLGIIKMFNALASLGGQPQPAKLAGGISIALVATFWGLMIAIPALTMHGFFQNKIETITSEAAGEVEKILPKLNDAVLKSEV